MKMRIFMKLLLMAILVLVEIFIINFSFKMMNQPSDSCFYFGALLLGPAIWFPIPLAISIFKKRKKYEKDTVTSTHANG